MVKNVFMTSYSPSVMINSTFKVEHQQFTCELEMMLIFYRHDGKWLMDTCDYGDMLSMEIDGKKLSNDDIREYIKFLKRIGLEYENECIDEVEKIIRSWNQEDIHKFIMKEVKIY